MSEDRWEPCPRCGARSIPLIFGLPSRELVESAGRGEVALGGCVRGDETHRCTRCGMEFVESARQVAEGPVVSGSSGEPKVLLALIKELRRVGRPHEVEWIIDNFQGFIQSFEAGRAVLNHREADVVTRLVGTLVVHLNRHAPSGLAFRERDSAFGWWPKE